MDDFTFAVETPVKQALHFTGQGPANVNRSATL
jgi:hypothetical protein